MNKKQKREEDEEWRKEIIKRDEKCQMCGSVKALNAHHILPRELIRTRHDLDNGIILCARCHRWTKFSAHQNAIFFSQWLRKEKPAVWEKLYIISKEEYLNEKYNNTRGN